MKGLVNLGAMTLILSGSLPASGAPAMHLENVDVPSTASAFDLKIFVNTDEELLPMFIIGVRWDPEVLDLSEINWAGTVFGSNGPPFLAKRIKPDGEPVLGLYTALNCDCSTRIPIGTRVPIANLRFERLPPFSGETSTVVRFTAAPAIGSMTGPAPTQVFIHGNWQVIATTDGAVRFSGSPLLLRGDANRDESVDLSDPVFTLGSLFLGQGELSCPDAADANDDSQLDLTDAVYVLDFLFRGGAFIPPPYPVPGPDPSEDALGCAR